MSDPRIELGAATFRLRDCGLSKTDAESRMSGLAVTRRRVHGLLFEFVARSEVDKIVGTIRKEI